MASLFKASSSIGLAPLKDDRGFQYRPDVDGLRAIAVMIVVFNHVHIHKFKGGFIGVDIFFVISGYLITSLILRDLDGGRFSFVDFWERRVRRIMPALSVTVLATLLVGMVLLMPYDVVYLGISGIAQTLFGANIFFKHTGGYFGVGSLHKPLLHTWSLAVEEQFYLFLPIILWSLYRIIKSPSRKAVFGFLSIGVIASFVWSVIALRLNDVGFSFFMLPARAWELLLGSLVALAPAAPNSRLFREVISWFSLSTIGITAATYSSATLFPGVAALPPCLAAAGLIWTNGMPGPQTTVARLLSLRPIVFIGLISYSLYLWHWPVIVFASYWSSTAAFSTLFRCEVVLISLLFGYLSWRYIETPFRKKQIFPSRKDIYQYAAFTIVGMLGLSTFVIFSPGILPRFNPEQTAAMTKITEAIKDLPDYVRVTAADIRKGNLQTLGREKERPDLILWGDSQASVHAEALDIACKEFDISGRLISAPATFPLLGLPRGSLLRIDKTEWAEASIDYIRDHRVAHVVIAAQLNAGNAGALRRTVDTLRGLGCKVWIIYNHPTYSMSVPKLLAREIVFGAKDDSWRVKFSDYLRRTAFLDNIRRELGDQVVWIDSGEEFLEPNTGLCRVEKDQVPLYSDTHHLTKAASKALILPLLRAQMKPFFPGSQEARDQDQDRSQ